MIQTCIALVLVVFAVAGLIMRAFAKKKSFGCGDDCACSSRTLKTKSPS
jgi:hypothetical protein